ncbi:MAG: hypothetical protein HOO67_07670, partial [Candidatus Peribacteraceae bacterium]|nr:hypothetical protein [Candidatus Peribacteraceae bacterium]
IAESLGQARKEDLSLGPEIAGGDIQLWIPSIRIRILIKELMLDKKKGDSFDRNGRDVWKEVAERPAEAAWISDVCSLRGSDAFGDEYHPPLGFAKAASERVFYEIRRINQERRIPIRWVLSAVAEVTHILDSSKKPVTVFDPTLLNQKGIDLTKRNRAKRGGGVYRNVYLGAQKARDMLIERIGGDPGFLRFNWHILAQEVWQEGDPPPRIEDQV